MKIRAEQLKAHLIKNLSPVYLLTGDEPFLKEEALQSIRKKAVNNGYIDRLIFTIDQSTPWQKLMDAVLEVSLFSHKKLIELQFITGKFSKIAKTKLEELLSLPLTDTLLLLNSPKLEAGSTRNKWYKHFDTVGFHVEIWPIDEKQFPSWIRQRLQQANLPTSHALIQALATLTAGNLLATQQEIEKLSLLSLPENKLIENITSSAYYTSFDFVNQTLQGNLKKARVILTHLQAEGIDAILVLWALTQEIRLSAKICTQTQRGKSFSETCQAFYVWPKRRLAIQDYLSRFALPQIREHLQSCSKIDKMIKGFTPGKPWFALLQLITAMSGVTVCI